MKNIFLLLLAVAVGWKVYSYSAVVTLGPGVMAAEIPHQTKINTPVQYTIDDYTITELATFRIKAKVLSKENYYIDRGADLSSTDLALGWGRMSDESVLDSIEITQSGRFYYWRVQSFPIPRREIETHSANMHLIPVDSTVEKAISRAKKGDIIEMSGSLVEVRSDTDSWRWKSSQTRNDTGGGACELVWVEHFDIVTYN